MLRKLLTFAVLAGIAALSWFFAGRYDSDDLAKVSQSFIAIAGSGTSS